MCGIFAYNVARERRYVVEVLFNGLRRLEYRGYDSSDCRTCSLKIHESGCNAVSDVGMGIESDGNLDFPYDSPPPLVFRQEGKIESLVRKFCSEAGELELNLEESFSVHAGIAHTRWATHGAMLKKGTVYKIPLSSLQSNSSVEKKDKLGLSPHHRT